MKVGLDSNSDDYELHFMKANALRDLNNLDLALEVSFVITFSTMPTSEYVASALSNICIVF